MQAAKRVKAAHRLVLSGTPIQNDVAELWALFDFLMPGFLGSQTAFYAQYGRALSDAKASARTQAQAEAGLLAMEKLHKQVCSPGKLCCLFCAHMHGGSCTCWDIRFLC